MKFFLLLIIVSFFSCSTYVMEIGQHRDQYRSGFLTDERSPLGKNDLDSLDFFPPSKKMVVQATFVPTPDEKPFELPTYSGITRTYRKFGVASFELQGEKASLSLYENMTLLANPVYKDYLFLPFKDETNGISTYGGGRYLNMSKADTEDGEIVIDFNKAYNPWCAFSSGYNCPIPPLENHLPFEVPAGEKQYKGHVKH